MVKSLKKQQPPCSCNYCWGYHDVFPEYVIYGIPKIFFIINYKNQAYGRCGRFLQNKTKDCIIFPVNICYDGIANKDIIKRRRENLFKVLAEYPEIPIVAFGEASQIILGGKCTPTSSANKVYEIDGHICAFTYDYDYYLLEGERNKHILDHIESTINASLESIDKLSWQESIKNIGKELIIDVETTSARFPWYGSGLIQLGVRDIATKNTYCVRPESIDREIKEKLSKVTKIIGHNVLYDLVHLNYVGINFPNASVHDTLIYHKNTHPNELFYGLKPLAKKYCGFPHWDAWFSSKIRSKETVNTADAVEWEKLCNYNAHDLFATELLYLMQQREIPSFNLEMDYLKYVQKMIMNGMYVDIKKWGELYEDISQQINERTEETKRLYGLGEDFNFNSPDQCLAWLQKYDNGISSTNAELLSQFLDNLRLKQHNVLESSKLTTLRGAISSLLEIRNLSKLKGTGLEGLKEHIDSNALVHSSYQVHGAETGRSSSSNPNMQNTDPRVRHLFVSRFSGGKLVHTDLSGIEYRLIGHASKDKILLDVFNSGKDIHDEMYFALFGEYPPNKTQRKKAKTANFCGVYGGGYKKFCISAELDGNDPESRRLFDITSNRYPGVKEWKDQVIHGLKRTLTVRNLFGRVRKFDYIDIDIEREAINWIIQSSGHDILKIYSMEINSQIEEFNLVNTLMVSEVHDSNTFDSSSDEYEKTASIITSIGSDLNPLIFEMFGVEMKCPIFAEVEVMDCWS